MDVLGNEALVLLDNSWDDDKTRLAFFPLSTTHLSLQEALGGQVTQGILACHQARVLLLPQQVQGGRVVQLVQVGCGLNSNHSGFDSASG